MIYDKKVTAIVPIKSETEMVEGHLRLFNNKPLYRTLLDKLERIFAIDEIIVDSDMHFLETELIKIYNKIKFIKRTEKLSKYDVNINDIIKYDVTQTLKGEIFIQTHINRPLLKEETIAKALKKFAELEDLYDSLFSVNAHKNRFYDNNFTPINHKKNELVRTRDLPSIYEENSCFYIFTNDSFNKTQNRIGEKPFLYEISSIEALELNDGLSYKLAEMLMLYQEL